MNKELKLLMIILSLVGFLTLSCESDDMKEPEIVKLDFEQKYQTKKLAIEFHSVLSDSRCPTGLTCIWAGNAEVQFSYTNTKGLNSDFTLNTNPGFRTDTLMNGYRIKLINVLPYPERDKDINYKDYSVEIEINKE